METEILLVGLVFSLPALSCCPSFPVFTSQVFLS